jgi:hypothetical protein
LTVGGSQQSLTGGKVARLVIVSNRVALPDCDRSSEAGGLAVAAQYGAGVPEFGNRRGAEMTVRIDTKVGEEIAVGSGQDESRRLRFVLETIGRTAWLGGKIPDEYAALVDKHNRKVLEDDSDDVTINAEIPPGRDVRCIISVSMLAGPRRSARGLGTSLAHPASTISSRARTLTATLVLPRRWPLLSERRNAGIGHLRFEATFNRFSSYEKPCPGAPFRIHREPASGAANREKRSSSSPWGTGPGNSLRRECNPAALLNRVLGK